MVISISLVIILSVLSVELLISVVVFIFLLSSIYLAAFFKLPADEFEYKTVEAIGDRVQKVKYGGSGFETNNSLQSSESGKNTDGASSLYASLLDGEEQQNRNLQLQTMVEFLMRREIEIETEKVDKAKKNSMTEFGKKSHYKSVGESMTKTTFLEWLRMSSHQYRLFVYQRSIRTRLLRTGWLIDPASNSRMTR